MSVVAMAGGRVPLVVDVDGTLLKTDLLHEATLQFVARHPFQVWRLAAWLLRGKAELKARLAERIDPGIAALPLRDEVLSAIRAEQGGGGTVYLASASDRRWVAPLAERIGDIAGVFASDGHTNLAGGAKAAALVDRFGRGGFDYVGDNDVDVPVWEAARQPLLISHGRGLEARFARAFPHGKTLARARPSLRAHVRALRPHQWAKNLLIFMPIVAGHGYRDPIAIFSALTAFTAFCLAASSAYIVNDLLDLPGDRDHVTKHRRPFASGEVPIVRGVAMAVLLMAAAATLAVLLPGRFAAILSGYVILTLAYSLVLKRRLLVDVITLGSLYTIRVFGGVAATGERQSQWLLMFSLFLFLSLAMVKRCSELIARRDAGRDAPPGRGYRIADLGVLVPLATAAGYAAVLVVALYLSSPEVRVLYNHPTRMWLVCPLLLYWISRVLVIAGRGELHEDPVIFALTDRISWLSGVLLAGIIAVSI